MEQENFLHDEELHELEEISKTAQSGDVIVVNGVWGFGKTKLIEKFKEKREPECLSINLWNSGFEKNVLYYFYKKISEEKDSFLNFYRWNIITVPIWFVISSFLLVNYFLPLLRKVIPDNNSCVYTVLLLIGIGMLMSLLYMIYCYIKKHIAKYIVFKKDFNSFFHEYFVDEIIRLGNKKNIQYIIVEDVDRLQRETIQELTTVIDSLKQNQKIEFKFIVSFNALKLLVPDEKDKQPEYYFDKVEKHRVNMGGVVEKSQQLFYSKLDHYPEIRNHNGFDRRVLGESFQYFENVISLRFIEKFAIWYERQREMENNQDKHPANMFVDFYLRQKQGMTEEELNEEYYVDEHIKTVNRIDGEKTREETMLIYLNKSVGKNNRKFLKGVPERNNLDPNDILQFLFTEQLPSERMVYNYYDDNRKLSLTYTYLDDEKVLRKIETIKDLIYSINEQRLTPTPFFTVLVSNYLSEDVTEFKNYVLAKAKIIQSVYEIVKPLKNSWNYTPRIIHSSRILLLGSFGVFFSFFETGLWSYDGKEVEILNHEGEVEKCIIQVSNNLKSFIAENREEYTESVDLIKWFMLLELNLHQIDTSGELQSKFYNVFLRLKEEIDNNLKELN